MVRIRVCRERNVLRKNAKIRNFFCENERRENAKIVAKIIGVEAVFCLFWWIFAHILPFSFVILKILRNFPIISHNIRISHFRKFRILVKQIEVKFREETKFEKMQRFQRKHFSFSLQTLLWIKIRKLINYFYLTYARFFCINKMWLEGGVGGLRGGVCEKIKVFKIGIC